MVSCYGVFPVVLDQPAAPRRGRSTDNARGRNNAQKRKNPGVRSRSSLELGMCAISYDDVIKYQVLYMHTIDTVMYWLSCVASSSCAGTPCVLSRGCTHEFEYPEQISKFLGSAACWILFVPSCDAISHMISQSRRFNCLAVRRMLAATL